jgi:steroid 5-alpha reductase family enzyme
MFTWYFSSGGYFMQITILLGLASVICAAIFAVCYALARRIDNYGIVDIVWSYAFGVVAILYAALGEGWWPRRWLVAGLIVGWSLRLGTYLYRRVMGHHPEEDGRYKEMRTRWAPNFGWEMFKFYQIQAFSVVVLALPFLFALGRTEIGFTFVDYGAFGLFFLAIAGESVADAQLAAFKRNPENKGKVCEQGLWGLSRHPNYFFVWLTWVSFALFALPAAWGWLGFTAPAAILYLLLYVTGIPLTEAQALRSKGDAYRVYQNRVSAFIPWLPRKS